MRTGAAHLVDVACGRRPAALYIQNGRVLNVYSGEVLEDVGVAVAAGRIAYVGPSRAMIGPETEVIDAAGGTLVPGYIDPHAHADLLTNLVAYTETVLPLGTTAVVTDTQAVVPLYGAAGLRYLKGVTAALPLHAYLSVPVVLSAQALADQGYYAGHGLTDAELAEWLSDPQVVSTSEFIPWRLLVDGDDRFVERFDLARARGKRREGHNPGATAEKLQALAAAGLTACHEALTAAEALARLRAGLYVMLRHGSVRWDLPALASLALQPGVDRSLLMLTPDWYLPGDLVRRGHMDYLIATAMAEGIAPLDAYRMATLNPARYFRIEDEVGAIAPGRSADILCLETLQRPWPLWTIARGRLVARAGRVEPGWLPRPPAAELPPFAPAVTVARAEDFRVAVSSPGPVTAPVAEIVNLTVTRRVDLELPVRDGAVDLSACSARVQKVAMPRPGGGFAIGFVTGLGPVGAIASTGGADPYFSVVTGSDDQEMAAAYNRMLSLGGGVVAMDRGRPAVELPLSIGGIISPEPVAAVADHIDALQAWVRRCGSPLEHFFIVHHFLTAFGVPFVRMTPWGLYEVRERQFLPTVLH